MSLTATLYVISPATFEQIRSGRSKIDISRNSLHHSTFEQNFEGLRFLLGKDMSLTDRAIIDDIFYPFQYIGKHVDLAENGPNILDGIMDFDSRIPYLNPSTIKKVYTLLCKLQEEDLINRYDAGELAREGIYPSTWHDETSDRPLSIKHVLAGFRDLKEILGLADRQGAYVLVHVG